jgi:hypothetical protein
MEALQKAKGRHPILMYGGLIPFGSKTYLWNRRSQSSQRYGRRRIIWKT